MFYFDTVNSTPAHLKFWDETADYGSEYARVTFICHTPYYDGSGGCWADNTHRAEFHSDVEELLQMAGFKKIDDCNSIFDMQQGYSQIFIHPTNMVAFIRKNDIARVAKMLDQGSTFVLKEVRVHENRFAGSKKEYKDYLENNRSQIKHEILNIIQYLDNVSIYNIYKELFDIKDARYLRMIGPVGCGINDPEIQFINSCVNELVDSRVSIATQIN